MTAAALVVALFGDRRADAAFVTYTVKVNATGSFQGRLFSNAPITITGTADTSNIFSPPSNSAVQILTLTSNSFTISGFAPASFTQTIQVAVNQTSHYGGFTVGSNGTTLLGVNNAAFGSYNLDTSTGPISGPAAVAGPTTALSTTAGNLYINSATSAASFQANVVPEPASLILASLGLAGVRMMACLRRRPAPRAGSISS